MRWPLKFQILVPFALLVCAAVIGLTIVNAVLASRRIKGETEQRLRGIANTLQDTSFPLKKPVLKQMRGLSGAEFVVIGQNGGVLAASRDASAWQGDPSMTAKQDSGLAGPVLFAGESYFHMTVSLDERARHSEEATLHIFYPERSYREARWAAVYPSLLVGAIVLVAAGCLSAWTANRLSRPLQSICAHVNRLATADFQALPVPSRNDELRDVVKAINRLASELDSMRHAIQHGERLALLGQLSAGMIHSLRNDVTGARIAVQLHQRECWQADQESLQVALRQLTLTEEHLKRFLAAGKDIAMRRVTTNLTELLQDVANLLAPTLKHRKIKLLTKLNAVEPMELDADQLRQAVIALMMNAMDVTGTQGQIEIRLEVAENDVCISVIDSGCGLPPDDIDDVFEAFVTTKPEGVGLGLTAARRTAEAHGGALTYRRFQQRTVFELLLPRTTSEQQRAEASCA